MRGRATDALDAGFRTATSMPVCAPESPLGHQPSNDMRTSDMISEADRIAEQGTVRPMTAESRDVGPVLVGNDPYIHLGDGTRSTRCGRRWTNDYRDQPSAVTCSRCRTFRF
jgi:hypothetical protein